MWLSCTVSKRAKHAKGEWPFWISADCYDGHRPHGHDEGTLSLDRGTGMEDMCGPEKERGMKLKPGYRPQFETPDRPTSALITITESIRLASDLFVYQRHVLNCLAISPQ